MIKKDIVLRLAGVFLLTVFLSSLAIPVGAFKAQSGERIEIKAGEIIEDDLYTMANTLIVNGTIKGDLVAFGSTITIGESGIVEGDLLAAGQAVLINGKVGDDVRAAGALIRIGDAGVVADDYIVAGYSIELEKGGEVGGDVVAFGSQVIIDGKVGGEVLANGQGLQLNGQVAGNVSANVGSPQDMSPVNPFQFMPQFQAMPKFVTIPGGLTIGDQALVGGDLEYSAPVEFQVPAGAVAGKINFTKSLIQPEEAEKPETSSDLFLSWLFGFLRDLAALLVVGLLFWAIFPAPIRFGADKLKAKWLACLGWGLVAYIGFFALGFVLLLLTIALAIFFGLITLGGLVGLTILIGIWLMLGLALVFYISSVFLAKLVVAYLVGRWIFSKLSPNLAENQFLPVLLGILLVILFISIPYLGIVLDIFITLFGLGALLSNAREWRQSR